MATDKSLEALEAELAALEAELAELEGKPKPPKPKPSPKPEPEAPAAAAGAPAADAPEKTRKSILPKLSLPFGKKKPATDAAPPEAAADAPLGEPEPTAEPPKKSRFALPLSLPRKSAPDLSRSPDPAPSTQAPPAPEINTAPPPAGTMWRQEGRTWIRERLEAPPVVLRRVLDADGNVVREEPATVEDLEEVPEIAAERGVAKLFSGSRLPSLRGLKFGRKDP